jgi:hypothetical protein
MTKNRRHLEWRLEELHSDPATLRIPGVQAALIDLVDRENHVAFNDDQEGYVEYVSEPIETVTGLVKWNDQPQVCILVRSLSLLTEYSRSPRTPVAYCKKVAQ